MPQTAAASAPNPAPAGRTALDVIRARGEVPSASPAPAPPPADSAAAPSAGSALPRTAPPDHVHPAQNGPAGPWGGLPASGLPDSRTAGPSPAAKEASNPPAAKPAAEEAAVSPRSFGLVVGAVCGLVGLWPAWRAGGPPAVWALAVGSLLIGLALLRPAWLALPARLWHRLGLALGWFNTRLLLGIAFVVLFVPLGLIRRLFGADPLQRAWDPAAPTYRTPARPREPGHVRRQS